jgi:hypothetical protein
MGSDLDGSFGESPCKFYRVSYGKYIPGQGWLFYANDVASRRIVPYVIQEIEDDRFVGEHVLLCGTHVLTRIERGKNPIHGLISFLQKNPINGSRGMVKSALRRGWGDIKKDKCS